MKSDFFYTAPTTDNLDRYVIRKGIEMAVRDVARNHFSGRVLDVGCGTMPYKSLICEAGSVTEYIGIDIEGASAKYGATPELEWDGQTIPFGDSHFDGLMLTEVLEHLADCRPLLREVARVLKFEGKLLITVPFFWPLHETPYDFNRPTPFLVEKILKDAGFEIMALKATGGWHASMAQMLGLWVRRGLSSPRKRKVFSALVFPIFKILLRMDKPVDPFKDGVLFPSFFVIARKKIS